MMRETEGSLLKREIVNVWAIAWPLILTNILQVLVGIVDFKMVGVLGVESIAAVVMGGTALSGGVGGPHRTIIGVAVIAILSNGLNLVGVHEYVQEIIKGLVVLAAAAITLDRSKIEMVK